MVAQRKLNEKQYYHIQLSVMRERWKVKGSSSELTNLLYSQQFDVDEWMPSVLNRNNTSGGGIRSSIDWSPDLGQSGSLAHVSNMLMTRLADYGDRIS